MKMNEAVIEFAEDYTEVVESCERFAFLPRHIDHQRKSIEELTHLLARSAKVRIEMIEEEDENAANQILALRCMMNALRFELKMWIDLKEENWAKGWDSMVDAQDSAKSAGAAHEIAQRVNVDGYLSKLQMIEEVVFPPQMFQSPGLFVERFTCSICGNDYSDCKHIAGKPYWGFFCRRIVEDTAGVREVSIVTNPEDKKARIVDFITDEGTVRNRLTWEESELDAEDQAKYGNQSEGDLITRGIVMTSEDTGSDFSEYFPD